MTGRLRAPLVAGFALCLIAGTAGCDRLRVAPVEHYRPAAAGATTGGRLVIGIEPPESIDPARVSDDAGRLISSLVCEPLVQLDARTGAVAHGIVTTVVPGGNGAVFTLALRSDVRFHDGRLLTAQDVAYSLSRIARHEVAAPDADILQPVLGYARLHAPPSPTDTRDPSEQLLPGVRAISKTAVQITLTERNAGFLRALSLPLAAPVPRRLPDRDSRFSDFPVCAGPYRLVKPYHYGDRQIELRRFRDYYRANDAYVGRGAGFADDIVFDLLPRDKLLAAYASGQVDVVRLPPRTLQRATDMPGQVVASPLPQVEFLATMDTAGPLSDPRVRRVLSRSLDRTRLVHDLYDGGRLPANRVVPPGTTSAPAPAACRDAVPTTAQPASRTERALLAPLIHSGLSLTVNADFANLAMARAVAAQWKAALGLRVTVVAQTWDRVQTELAAPTGIRGLFRTSWQPAYPSEDATLRPLLGSGAIGTDNVTRYRNRDLDRLLDHDARQTTDNRQRAAKYAAAEQLACRDMPLIPLTFSQTHYLVRDDRLATAGTGFTVADSGQLDLREIYVRRRT